jgi:hypothetical protein
MAVIKNYNGIILIARVAELLIICNDKYLVRDWAPPSPSLLAPSAGIRGVAIPDARRKTNTRDGISVGDNNSRPATINLLFNYDGDPRWQKKEQPTARTQIIGCQMYPAENFILDICFVKHRLNMFVKDSIRRDNFERLQITWCMMVTSMLG